MFCHTVRPTNRDIMQGIMDQPLAFSTASSLRAATTSSTLIAASSRIPFETVDKSATLNVELFESNRESSSPIILFVHGVCASCETLSIQNLVSAAKSNGVNVAVLELEGHGISSGSKGCLDDFDRCVRHVLEFVSHTLTIIGKESRTNVPYVIGGISLGGILAAYASSIIVKKPSSCELQFPGRFLGVAPLNPAVGVHPNAVPSYYIIQALKLLAYIAPRSQPPLTPLEDPVKYNCPKGTERNFSGHWPLATSKLLLDITSNRVTKDLNRDESDGEKLDLAGVPSVLIIAGEEDDVVPIESVRNFYYKLASKEKEFVAVPEGGHDLMTGPPSSHVATTALFRWIEKIVSQDSIT